MRGKNRIPYTTLRFYGATVPICVVRTGHPTLETKHRQASERTSSKRCFQSRSSGYPHSSPQLHKIASGQAIGKDQTASADGARQDCGGGRSGRSRIAPAEDRGGGDLRQRRTAAAEDCRGGGRPRRKIAAVADLCGGGLESDGIAAADSEHLQLLSASLNTLEMTESALPILQSQ
jgi:hypothetical protein